MAGIESAAWLNSGLCLEANTYQFPLPILFRRDVYHGQNDSMRFSRNQIIGAVALLLVIWLVIAIRLIIARG